MTDLIEVYAHGSADPVQWRVSCPAHGLDARVDSEAHATNLFVKHQREQHLGDLVRDVNLTQAARWLCLLDAGTRRTSQLVAGLGLWVELTGMTEDDALAYAHQLADADHDVIAAVPPL